MKRISLVLALLVVMGLTLHDIYEFLVTNEGVRYFSSDPRRLLAVVLISLLGGCVAFGISRLWPRSQRSLNLVALGTFGTVFLGVLGRFAYLVISKTPGPDASTWGVAVAVFLVFGLNAGIVWFEFRRVRRRTQ